MLSWYPLTSTERVGVCYSIFIQQDLKVLEREFGASPVRTQFEHYERLCAIDPKHFKPLASHARIYPNYFAPVIANRDNKNWLIPMRYRVRPSGSIDEIPTNYNVFNARLESLTTRPTWSRLLGRQHGLVVFKEFYEWVPGNGPKNKKVISFRPDGFEFMWAPVLWDWWESPDKNTSYFSFALITGEPPDQVLAAGHDRCPVFLDRSLIPEWLNPVGKSAKELTGILQKTTSCNWIVKDATP